MKTLAEIKLWGKTIGAVKKHGSEKLYTSRHGQANNRLAYWESMMAVWGWTQGNPNPNGSGDPVACFIFEEVNVGDDVVQVTLHYDAGNGYTFDVAKNLNNGETETQERRNRTALEYHETINHNTYNTMNNPTLLKNLRCIPDFPKPGIQFQDVTTLFKNAECLRIMRDEIVDMYRDKGITKIVGIESRGFMLAGVVAAELGAGVVMCRKPGKLPGETIKESYMKEYGEDTIEIHKDSITEDDVVLIHDDLLATGGSMRAAYDLMQKFPAENFTVTSKLKFIPNPGNKNKGEEAGFTADEIERVAYLTTKGYLPVAVDVASRVFQVCYYDLGVGYHEVDLRLSE